MPFLKMRPYAYTKTVFSIPLQYEIVATLGQFISYLCAKNFHSI